MMPKPITVYILDDDPEWCQSLQWLLASVNLHVEIYHNGASFFAAYNPANRGCLLLDIRMPGMSGLQVQERLNELESQMPVIIVSGHADVPLAVRAMKAGAFDLVTKPFNEQQLLEQIYKAIERDKYRYDKPQQSNVNKLFATLTTREREVMLHVANGKLNKQIAGELGISIKTVELHRAHLMQKLGVRTLADLLKMYMVSHQSRLKTTQS